MNTSVATYVDKFLIFLAVLVLFLSVFFGYRFEAMSFGRITLFVVALIVPSAFFFISGYGVHLRSFFKEANKELAKVVWPSVRETIRMSFSLLMMILFLVLVSYLFDAFWSFLIYKGLFGV
jgi:preprotein translocase subunit SecE